MVKVKVFGYIGPRSRSRSLSQKLWYHWKGLITRNVYVKYVVLHWMRFQSYSVRVSNLACIVTRCLLYEAQCLSLNVLKVKMSIFYHPSRESEMVADGFDGYPCTRPVLDIQQSGLAGRNLSRLYVTWIKHSSNGVSFFWSVLSRVVSSQPYLPETIYYSVSSCFINIKWTATSLMLMPVSAIPITQLCFSLVVFRDSTYLKFIKLLLLVYALFPITLLTSFFLAATSHNHGFIKIKGVPVNVARATIKQRIISQPWLWSDR